MAWVQGLGPQVTSCGTSGSLLDLPNLGSLLGPVGKQPQTHRAVREADPVPWLGWRAGAGWDLGQGSQQVVGGLWVEQLLETWSLFMAQGRSKENVFWLKQKDNRIYTKFRSSGMQ